MPVYQYKCRNCGYDLEARQGFADDPLQECPNCGAPQGLYRVIQPAGVVFKGSGFYINDSKGSKREITAPAKKTESDSAAPAASEKSEKSTSSDAPATSTPAASTSSTASTPATS